MGEDCAALKCYKELLRASLDAGDAVGEALACNCIGVAMLFKVCAYAYPRWYDRVRDHVTSYVVYAPRELVTIST